MEQLIENIRTRQDIEKVCSYKYIDYNLFKDKKIYITGVTGTIGSFMVSCLVEINKKYNLNLKIIGAARNIKKARSLFSTVLKDNKDVLTFFCSDVINPVNYKEDIDYIVHCANNTASASYVENPVETFDVAVKGTENILDLARKKNIKSMVFLSSMEVYGYIEKPVKLKETDLGSIDISEARSSYPIGKRAAETLCFSYAKEYNVPVKIARLAQVIGANVNYDDSRVYAQFGRSIIEKRDIVLNTNGEKTSSYCYITDVITGIFTLLLNGENAQVYNIANETASMRIKDIAEMLAEKYIFSKLVFDIKEDNPYFKETHWVLDCSKILKLGWHCDVSLNEAYDNLINSFYFQFYPKEVLSLTYKNFLQRIFSVKNTHSSKIITIAGIKFEMPINIFTNTDRIHKKYGITKNKIVFSNYMGNDYGCNPKYITEELLKRNLNLDIVWLVKNIIPRSAFPSGVRIENYNSSKAMFELATAKVWVDNYHKIKFVKRGLTKHPEQKYIQTWHGSLGIKKIEKQVGLLNKNPEWTQAAIKNSKMTDYWISNSKFETNVYKESFWDVENIKELGHPRNDIFFSDSTSIKEKVYKYYKIDKNKKLILYVPSFREGEDTQCYNIDYEKVMTALSKKFSGEWIFLVRFHPRIANYADSMVDYKNSIINATRYPDIQELLVSSEAIITDYSSCIFDFMLSHKPGFIYAEDIEKYNIERGFYYPLNKTPFPIAVNNTGLLKNILDFDNSKYKKDVDIFLKEKGCIEDGNASKRVADLIEEIIKA